MSISGAYSSTLGGWADDSASSTDDNCFCVASEVIRVDAALYNIDLACFIFFILEVIIRFLGYRSNRKFAENLLNWASLKSKTPSNLLVATDGLLRPPLSLRGGGGTSHQWHLGALACRPHFCCFADVLATDDVIAFEG